MFPFRRLREATAVSSEPQLVRGRDEDLDEDDDLDPDDDLVEVDQAYRDKAHAGGHSLPDKSYPILDKKRLHSAATLAASHHGDWKAAQALIRKEAKRLGVDVDTLPGFKKASESQPFTARVTEADVRRRGAAFEVVLIREGCGNSQDGNFYSAESLRNAVARGLFNTRCHADHQTRAEEAARPERSVRTLIGSFSESRYVEGSPGEVRAAFRPLAIDWVKALAESAVDSPGLVGFSINGAGAPTGEMRQVDGREYHVVSIDDIRSVDLVVEAGAGGRFVRKLSESLREAEAAAPLELTASKLQESVRDVLGVLRNGIADEDEAAITRGLQDLTRVARAQLRDASADLREADTRITEFSRLMERADAQIIELTARATSAEARADAGDRVRLAQALLREVRDVPLRTKEAWVEELVLADDEDAMRMLFARRMVEHEDMLGELRESLDLGRVEGAGPRQPATPSNGYSAADGRLLAMMNIDPRDVYDN